MKRVLLLLIFVSALVAPAAAFADSPTHVVAYGETLYSIARQYGVSPAALAAANGITTQSWVYAGQRLTIPGAGDYSGTANSSAISVAQATPGGIYMVRAGDTLSSVSRKFGVSVHAIADANDIPPNGFLYTGWQLKIPGARTVSASVNNAPAANSANAPNPPQAAANPTTPYIVRAGDTLYGIAIRHNVTMAAIRIANNLPTPFVYTGQRLIIPNTATASTPAVKSSNSAPAGLLARVENVPAYRQEQTLTCEESAASMALRGALSEAEIVSAMPRSDNPFQGIRGSTDYSLIGGLTHYGTYAQALQKGLAKLGRQSTVYYGQSYAQFKTSLVENLKQGHPVIWWTTWRESHQRPQMVQVSDGTEVPLTPYEHAVVIVAATEQGVTYHDPYDGSVRFTNWENHRRTSGYFNNMALVIY
jgi:LysM repeat protein/uncharacterized protein YvpB